MLAVHCPPNQFLSTSKVKSVFLSEWSDQPAAFCDLHPVLWPLPYPQTGRDQEEAVVTAGWAPVILVIYTV